jgi:RHS repeat-associated protein
MKLECQARIFSLTPGVSTRCKKEQKQMRAMEMTVEIGGRGEATIVFPLPGAYTSPTTPGSAPADTGSTLLYQHADHLTTRVTTDNAGTLSNQQAHYPYGEGWYSGGTADPSVTRKFTSYRKEGGSLASGQINYAIARYHGARIGRFHRPDPVRGNFRNPQRLNRYAYVTNNPVRYVDPKGLDMSDGIGPEWQCPQGPGNCIVPVGGGLIVNPNSYGGMHPFNAEAYANYVQGIEELWAEIQAANGGGLASSGIGVGNWADSGGERDRRCRQNFENCKALVESAFSRCEDWAENRMKDCWEIMEAAAGPMDVDDPYSVTRWREIWKCQSQYNNDMAKCKPLGSPTYQLQKLQECRYERDNCIAGVLPPWP